MGRGGGELQKIFRHITGQGLDERHGGEFVTEDVTPESPGDAGDEEGEPHFEQTLARTKEIGVLVLEDADLGPLEHPEFFYNEWIDNINARKKGVGDKHEIEPVEINGPVVCHEIQDGNGMA